MWQAKFSRCMMPVWAQIFLLCSSPCSNISIFQKLKWMKQDNSEHRGYFSEGWIYVIGINNINLPKCLTNVSHLWSKGLFWWREDRSPCQVITRSLRSYFHQRSSFWNVELCLRLKSNQKPILGNYHVVIPYEYTPMCRDVEAKDGTCISLDRIYQVIDSCTYVLFLTSVCFQNYFKENQKTVSVFFLGSLLTTASWFCERLHIFMCSHICLFACKSSTVACNASG